MPRAHFITARQHLDRRSPSARKQSPLTLGVAPLTASFTAPSVPQTLTQRNAALLDTLAELADAELAAARAAELVPLAAAGVGAASWLPPPR